MGRVYDVTVVLDDKFDDVEVDLSSLGEVVRDWVNSKAAFAIAEKAFTTVNGNRVVVDVPY